MLRLLLCFCALGGVPAYPALIVWALFKHTLFTVDHNLLDPGNLLWYAPLSAASIWALVDLWKEDDYLRQQRRAKLRRPFEEDWKEKLVAARATGDRNAELVALSNVGFWLWMGDHYEEAVPYLQEALALARTLGDHPFDEERALYGLGQAAFNRGDLDTAEELFRQSLAVAGQLGPDRRDEVATTYAHVGEFLAHYRDKREEGCQMLAQAQAIYHELGQSRPRWLHDEQHMRNLRRQYGDDPSSTVQTGYMTRADIQSRTWLFASPADRQRFDDAVARLPDLEWAAEERHARPLQRDVAQAIALPGRTVLDKWFDWTSRHVRSTTRRRGHFAGDYDELVLACAVAMSSAEHPIIRLTHTAAGARIVSDLPFTWRTWPGTLTLELHADDDGRSTVAICATFPQVIDWFRGRYEVNRVWQDVRSYLAALGAQQELEPGA